MSEASRARVGNSAAATAPVVATVVGGSGFVGTAVVAQLRSSGVQARPLAAPRLGWDRVVGDFVPPDHQPEVVERLAEQFDGVRVVVNAAGIANGKAPTSPELYGANALLPVLIARACALAGVHRFIQVSSAAVQGRRDLDESTRTAPFSGYTDTKALAEQLLTRVDGIERVIFRPTWVHAVGRANTRSLVRLAHSRASCVAGDGSAPTPQVLITDVAAALGYLVLTEEHVPPVVLQPPSGMTTGLILRLLGDRDPRRLPPGVARALVAGIRAGAPLSASSSAYARRAEMLLFGKRQAPGWLADRNVVAPLNPGEWRQLASPSAAAVSANSQPASV